ncbi:hypothetical protein MMC20_002478 [Loxospora ochrophaea]|nr:hypothetical protein [Loxospora ochrophaea]
MSFSTVNVPLAEPAPAETPASPPKQTYKSYKKKYRKMKHTFDEKLKKSNQLYADEQKAMKLAQRLQEQNDQILDLLLDINSSQRLAPHLRYDLRSPTPSLSAVPALSPDLSPRKTTPSLKAALSALQEAKIELTTGQIFPETYTEIEDELTAIINAPRPLSRLDTQTPHTFLSSVPADEFPSDLDETHPIGYLSPTHEETFLATVDAALSPASAPRQPTSHPIRTSEKYDREREAQLRNPVSVYNWLRKHHPQVFLQDNESTSEKPSTRGGGGSKATAAGGEKGAKSSNKRQSAQIKQEHEVIDEEGFVVGGAPVVEGSGKTKRKREDEPYRPKGGSSRPTKKKRVSGGRRGGAEEDGG